MNNIEVTVAIPTYNESPNIRGIVEEVRSELSGREHEIIVVDGGSTDGTPDMVKQLSEEFDNVHAILRDEREGIGSAYQEALKAAEGDIVVQMDADFSHPPSALPDLVAAVKDGADVAVGSRYVEGGERKDPLTRRVFPLIGSHLYRLILRSPVRDVTSGFKAYDREVVEYLSSQKLPDGFHFQAASLFAALGEGYSVEEVPITFRPRKSGDPKYSARDLLDNVLLLGKLSLQKHRKMFKFGFIGGLGLVLNTALLYLFTDIIGFYYLFSAVFAGEAAILFNFILHDAWTFRGLGEKGVLNWLRRLYQYHAVSLAGIGLTLFLLWLFTDILGIYYILSNILAVSLVFLWNYGANVSWTWSGD